MTYTKQIEIRNELCNIDNYMVEDIKWLNKNDYYTQFSCSGIKNDHPYYPINFDYGYGYHIVKTYIIFINLTQEKKNDIISILTFDQAFYIEDSVDFFKRLIVKFKDFNAFKEFIYQLKKITKGEDT